MRGVVGVIPFLGWSLRVESERIRVRGHLADVQHPVADKLLVPIPTTVDPGSSLEVERVFRRVF